MMTFLKSEHVKSENIKPLEIQKFLGSWRVIAAIPTPFEYGILNPVETYSWNSKENRIDVSFDFERSNGQKKKIRQKAWIVNQHTNAEWKVQFFWPLKFDLWIYKVSADYRSCLLVVPSKKFAWIMDRQKDMPQETYSSYLDVLKKEKFPTHKLIRFVHKD